MKTPKIRKIPGLKIVKAKNTGMELRDLEKYDYAEFRSYEWLS